MITGWDEQTCRDAIQYSYNAWLREFGTGNKEHQQIIEQTEAFLNAYGMSRFAPFPYDPSSLPISNMAGYRQKGGHEADPMVFYTFPAAFEGEIGPGLLLPRAAGGNPRQPAGGNGLGRPRLQRHRYRHL